MANSFAEWQTQLPCLQCRRAFKREIWLIIDAAERPDLLVRVRNGVIHDVICPNGHNDTINAPLLLYRPGEEPLLLFSRAEGMSDEQYQKVARQLLARLAESLGNRWQRDWVKSMAVLQHGALPEYLELLQAKKDALKSLADLERAQAAVAQTVKALTALTSFLSAETWFASYQVVSDHPALLTDAADATLASLVEQTTADGYEDLAQGLAGRLALLRRARVVGVGSAFAEKLSATAKRLPVTEAEQTDRTSRPAVRRALAAIGAAVRAKGVKSIGAKRQQQRWPRGWNWQHWLSRGDESNVPPAYREDVLRALAAVERFQTTGDPVALDEAAVAWEQVLTDPRFSEASQQFQMIALNDTGNVFLRRYQAGSRLTDLDAALRLLEAALATAPPNSSYRAGILNNLGVVQGASYLRTGQPEDLGEAIVVNPRSWTGRIVGYDVQAEGSR